MHSQKRYPFFSSIHLSTSFLSDLYLLLYYFSLHTPSI
nr:MAG TPA: hypothetical protein [Caudoviricetes sp.]